MAGNPGTHYTTSQYCYFTDDSFHIGISFKSIS
jgi:hypothetical protein